MKSILKISGILFCTLVLSFAAFSCSEKQAIYEKTVEASEEATAAVLPQGRIIVLIVDISQSIKGQLDAIIDGLCDEIVEKKLLPGDYCVIVPLGDATNAGKAKSFGVQFSMDKENIKEYLHQIKSWMPSNLNTDIGAAMSVAFEYINKIDAENNGNMYDPLVLLMTDGEIYESPYSDDPVRYKLPEEIFNDPAMNPARNSYENWWFLGIENEGVPLEHIKRIAQEVGAYPERYMPLRNMSIFGQLFDEWLSGIPDPAPKDNGRISFSDVRIGGKPLSQNDSSYTVVSTGESFISWTVRSSYSRTDVVLKFDSVGAVFQNASSGESKSFFLIPEAGNLELAHGVVRETGLNVQFPRISGKGRLKLEIKADVQAASTAVAQEIPEYLFYVEFKSPLHLLLEKIALPVLILVVIIIAAIVIRIAKARAAVKIRLEIIGKSNSKAKPVSMRIHKRAEFGSKPGASFKLEGSGYSSVIGVFERTGSKSYKVTPRDAAAFAPGQEKLLEEYKLGSGIKLVLKDKSSVTIKFRK